MSKVRRKGFTDGASSYMDEEDYQKEGYFKLANQYDVTTEDIDRIVNEVFNEVPEQRFFCYWTEQHYKEFDRAMKEYLKEQGYETGE